MSDTDLPARSTPPRAPDAGSPSGTGDGNHQPQNAAQGQAACLLAKVFGLNWKTTLGGTMAAAGGVLASSTTGRWQVVGQILSAVGVAWLGFASRDKNVSTAQMDAQKGPTP